MNHEPFVLVAGVIAGGFGVWWFYRRRAAATLESAREVTDDSALSTIDCLVVGDMDAPLITITTLVAPTLPSVSMPDSIGLASSLGPLLNRAPELLRLGHDMTTKTLRVVFSPEVTRSLQSGALTHVQDAAKQLLPVARDARTGRFVEVGRAVKTGGVRLANIAAATWQIAAIATAQHYLGEINARLQRLEDRVADIHFFLKEDKRAELRAIVIKLREYHESLLSGRIAADDLLVQKTMMENFDQRCLAIGELARESAKRQMESLDALPMKELKDPRGSVTRATEWLKQSQEALELVFFAQSCRILGCHVKAALPDNRAILFQRITQARNEVRTATDHLLSLQHSFHSKVVEPLNPERSFWQKVSSKFHRDHRPKAKDAFAIASQVASELAQQIDRQAAQAQQFAEQFERLANSGMALDVRFNPHGTIEIVSVQPA